MRKDIFESEEEVANVILSCMSRAVTDIAIDSFIDNAKRLNLIKQSPLEKVDQAWMNFYSNKYVYKNCEGVYTDTNDEWAASAANLMNAQEEVIEYLKQKLEEKNEQN